MASLRFLASFLSGAETGTVKHLINKYTNIKKPADRRLVKNSFKFYSIILYEVFSGNNSMAGGCRLLIQVAEFITNMEEKRRKEDRWGKEKKRGRKEERTGKAGRGKACL